MAIFQALTMSLPDWVSVRDGECYEDDAACMEALASLAVRNVREGLGGPFAAGVVHIEDRRLIAAGVNTVLASACSVAHAEMVALMRAQAKLNAARLDRRGDYALYTTAQPCSMCYGALPWAGIRRLVVGARRRDVEGIGNFDEGPLPSAWKSELRGRGIEVRTDVLREQCCGILREYRDAGGAAY